MEAFMAVVVRFETINVNQKHQQTNYESLRAQNTRIP
jgi:hypothetical protein